MRKRGEIKDSKVKEKRECEFELEHFEVAQSLRAVSTGYHTSLG